MDRQIPLIGCHNFRDLGGYPTTDGAMLRWRQLFRSDGLEQLTAEDVSHLRFDLRIGDVIDLRSSGELRAEGRGPLAGEPLRFHHLPLFDGDTRGARDDTAHITLGRRYFLLARMAAERIGAVISVLGHTTAPAVYHCAAGKDRTGVISAILLGVLGVPDAVIVADYAATKENLDAIVERLMARKGYRTVLRDLPADTLHAEPETMIEFLELIRAEYGSMRDYARQAGVRIATIDRLHDRLLTPR
jgi:protein-tyrosine phosphatase